MLLPEPLGCKTRPILNTYFCESLENNCPFLIDSVHPILCKEICLGALGPLVLHVTVSPLDSECLCQTPCVLHMAECPTIIVWLQGLTENVSDPLRSQRQSEGPEDLAGVCRGGKSRWEL